MQTLKKLLSNFRDSESGATLVEYGIAITLAIVLGTGALSFLSGEIGDSMSAAGELMCTDSASCTN